MPHPIHIAFSVGIRGTNPAAIRRHASALTGKDFSSCSMASAITAALLNPVRAPADTGFEILSSTKATLVPGTLQQWKLIVEVLVHDQDALIKEARRRYGKAWRDSRWRPENLHEAAYEVLLASNKNPPPSDIGYAMGGYEAVVPTFLPRLPNAAAPSEESEEESDSAAMSMVV